MIRQFVASIFYGNIFYACCTVALCIETVLLAGLHLNDPLFYAVMGCATLIFYGLVYHVASRRINPQLVSFDRNNRTIWYSYNRKLVAAILISALITATVCGILYWMKYQQHFHQLGLSDLFLLFIFPFLSFGYSFDVLPFTRLTTLRSIGWLKPFILGFIWAGFVTYYPLIAAKFEGSQPHENALPVFWLFIQNFLFISMLCVLFDIKDVQQDTKVKLRTIPVSIGISNTVKYVIIPIAILNILIKLIFTSRFPLEISPVLIRTTPYLLLIWLSLQVRKPRSTLFYLAVIDGLMLVKAIIGIFSIHFK